LGEDGIQKDNGILNKDIDWNIIYDTKMKELLDEVFKFNGPSQGFSLNAIRSIHKYVSYNVSILEDVYIIDDLSVLFGLEYV